jgi:uncharacterized protein YoxC
MSTTPRVPPFSRGKRIHHEVNQSINQSVTTPNQSINQSFRQINQSINQSINHSAKSINQLVIPPNQSINQSLRQINQSITYFAKSINQSISHSAKSINQSISHSSSISKQTWSSLYVRHDVQEKSLGPDQITYSQDNVPVLKKQRRFSFGRKRLIRVFSSASLRYRCCQLITRNSI